MTELAKSLCFYLAYTLTGNVEYLADLLKGAGTAVLKTKTQSEHSFLPRGEGGENFGELLPEKRMRGCVLRGRCIVIGNKIAEVAVLLLADRCLK